MSVTVRKYKRGGWQVDIRVRLSNGKRHRERHVVTHSKSAAQRWGDERERHVLLHGADKQRREVPTVREFASRFVEGHARANRHKPSGIAAKEMILRVHLIPRVGDKRLDAISSEDIQHLKRDLSTMAAKTANNILTVLQVLLKKAVEWGVIEQMPCVIKLLPVAKTSMPFHGFEEFEQLVETAASDVNSGARLMVLLAGEAGLRCGELLALEWDDVDAGNRQLCVQRAVWKGQVTAPKGGRLRYIPLTARLASALRDARHLKSKRVLCQDDGTPLTRQMVQYRVRKAATRAQLAHGGVHILRHTFCSHLAMFGASAVAIQALAGHRDLSTTQRYMHLSQSARESAMQLLEDRGNGVATATEGARKISA